MSSTPTITLSGSARPDSLSSRLDRLGIVASLGCALHCLAAPFLFLLLPTLGSVWSHPAAHWLLAALVLPLAGVVVWRGYRLHRKRSALIAMGLGAAFIMAGLILPALPTAEGHAAVMDGSAEHYPVAGGNGAEAEVCVDDCCPTIVHDAQTGSTSMSFPAASVVTMIGSVLLVTAHGVNLWGCACFSRQARQGDGRCGCPTHG